ncbi:adenosine kinase [Oceanicoccus sp. KOV_DT_Chl]|uniref:adenosine kinase n=1 Tax=Oceanicoccus sp. KOV_DT_Chl TaxID=1904639 RepID=UPI000C7ACAD1|nr:adenosine kinase [Oceanicoccus sp. KOV_DT_Chl]
MKTYHLYGIGAALVDTEIEVSDQDLQDMGVEKGLMTLVDADQQQRLTDQLTGHMVHAKLASGGSACNSIYAASCFGAKSFYSCKVANDDNGNFFLNDLKTAGVDCNSQHHGDDGNTGKCLVLITPDAERSMNTHLGISESLSAAQINAEAIAQSEYLYMEGYLVTSDTGRAAAIQAREIAEKNGVKTAISLSDPGMVEFFKDGLQAMIGTQVSLLFCNEDEAKGWADSDNIDDAITALKLIADTFAITMGAKGALIFDGERLINIAANKVKAIDTNGAGDMFAGAFLFAITHGHSYQTAGELASLAAANVVSNYGPRLNADKHGELLTRILN